MNLSLRIIAKQITDEIILTVLVSMGGSRTEDRFYVLPTAKVRSTISIYRKFYLGRMRRDGLPRKDTGHWTLHLTALKSEEDRPNVALAQKWAEHLDAWHLLETAARIVD